MAADQPVFMPDQSYHENIEDRQHDEAKAVRVGEAVELVDDEQAHDDQGNRIGPKLVSEQADDEEHLDKAVAEKIEGIEALGADGKILRQAQKMRRDEVVRILDQLLLGERVDQIRNGAGADEGDDKAADALDESVRSFQQDADLENLVDAAFVHAFLA